jgi:hypothetical protein
MSILQALVVSKVLNTRILGPKYPWGEGGAPGSSYGVTRTITTPWLGTSTE